MPRWFPSVSPAKSGTPFTGRIFRLSKILRMAVTKATNSARHSVYGWASVYWGWYYKHKEFAILWRGKSKPCNTMHFQQWFLVNVWCGVRVLSNKLTGHVIQGCYPLRILNFFGKRITSLFTGHASGKMVANVPRTWGHLHISGERKWNFFNKILKEDGLEQMDKWPSLSPNLNPDFFLWRCMKGCVCHGYMQEGSLTTKLRNIRYI
jgi:hypothetical protein